MPDKVKKLFDTNILVHAYVLLDPKKHAVAQKLVQHIWESGGGVTTVQNICEFFVVVTRKIEHPMPVEIAEVIVQAFLSSKKWMTIDRRLDTVASAMAMVREYRTPFWDALIAACMIDNGFSAIVTENERDFRRIPGVVVINPFKHSST